MGQVKISHIWTLQLPSTIKSDIGFPLFYLNLTLAYSKGQRGSWNGLAKYFGILVYSYTLMQQTVMVYAYTIKLIYDLILIHLVHSAVLYLALYEHSLTITTLI